MKLFLTLFLAIFLFSSNLYAQECNVSVEYTWWKGGLNHSWAADRPKDHLLFNRDLYLVDDPAVADYQVVVDINSTEMNVNPLSYISSLRMFQGISSVTYGLDLKVYSKNDNNVKLINVNSFSITSQGVNDFQKKLTRQIPKCSSLKTAWK